MVYKTGYIKLSRKSLHGTAIHMPNDRWGFFTRLLLLAEKTGHVRILDGIGFTVEQLADITNDTEEGIEGYLCCLSAPDPKDPDQENEGRRIERQAHNIIFVLNYAKYQTGWERRYSASVSSEESGDAEEPTKPEPAKPNPLYEEWVNTLHNIMCKNVEYYKLRGKHRKNANSADFGVVRELFEIDRHSVADFELAFRALGDDWDKRGFHPIDICHQVSTLRERIKKRKMTKFEMCVEWGQKLEAKPISGREEAEAEWLADKAEEEKREANKKSLTPEELAAKAKAFKEFSAEFGGEEEKE